MKLILGIIKKHKISFAIFALAFLLVFSVLLLRSDNNKHIYADYVDTSEGVAFASLSIEDRGRTSQEVYLPVRAQESIYDEAQERMLISQGSLSMTVRDITETRTNIKKLVQLHSGYIESENFNTHQKYSKNEYHDAQSTSGNVRLKVPSEKYEEVFNTLRTYALVVSSEYSNVSDVTERFIDLETRIENKIAEEQGYRELLAQADKVSDMLEVTRYIEQARVEAEQLQGQLNVLDNQIKLSSIDVYLESEDEYEFAGISWSPGDVIANAWRSVISSLLWLINSLMYLLVLLPAVIIYALILFVVYKITRSIYNKYILNNKK